MSYWSARFSSPFFRILFGFSLSFIISAAIFSGPGAGFSPLFAAFYAFAFPWTVLLGSFHETDFLANNFVFFFLGSFPKLPIFESPTFRAFSLTMGMCVFH